VLKHKVAIACLLYSLCCVNTAVAGSPWSMSQTSLGKQFSAVLNCDAAPSIGKFQSCSFQLTQASDDKTKSAEPIKNAKIIVGGGMPTHQHGLPTNPIVKWSSKEDAYQVEGLKFSMPGAWVLHFYIDALDKPKAEKDTVSFNFTI